MAEAKPDYYKRYQRLGLSPLPPPEQTVEECIQGMVEHIVRGFQPLQILLFGSHARENAGPHSDIDLIVVLAEVENNTEKEVEILESLGVVGYSKDVLVATPEQMEEEGSDWQRVL